MKITNINTVNLYRIQGQNSKISRKRIVYKNKTEEVKILYPQDNIYLSVNNAHHYYFTIKQIRKLLRKTAQDNNETYNKDFLRNILNSSYKDYYIKAIKDAKIQSVNLEIPLFLYNYILKFASYNLTVNNTLRIPELADTSKCGGAISSMKEWNNLIELLTLNLKVKDFDEETINRLLESLPYYHDYIFGRKTFSYDYSEKKNSTLFKDETQEHIKELLEQIFRKNSSKLFESTSTCDTNNFIHNYKQLIKRL